MKKRIACLQIKYVGENNQKLFIFCDEALKAPSIVEIKKSHCQNKQMCKQKGTNQTEQAFDLINN